MKLKFTSCMISSQLPGTLRKIGAFWLSRLIDRCRAQVFCGGRFVKSLPA
jgi:hypothetical protein